MVSSVFSQAIVPVFHPKENSRDFVQWTSFPGTIRPMIIHAICQKCLAFANVYMMCGYFEFTTLLFVGRSQRHLTDKHSMSFACGHEFFSPLSNSDEAFDFS